MIWSGWGNAPLRRMLLVSAVALIPVLSGCEAGNNAPTLEFHYPTDAAGTVVGDLSIRNVFVLGAPLGSSLQPGQSASLFFAVVNNGKRDTLIGITAPGSATSVQVLGGSVPIVQFNPVLFTGPQPHAFLVNLTRQITNGSSILIVLHFKNAGAVPLAVPIETRAAQYAALSPPPTTSPTPAAPPTASIPARKGHRPHVTPTPTPTPTPSPS